MLSSVPMLVTALEEAFAGGRVCLEHATSGEAALRRALCGCSTAILVDDEPPDMTTAELLRSLRSTERGRDALVVLMSSKASEIDRVIAFELGADDFILKPIGTRELSLRLNAVLRRHRDGQRNDRELRVGPFVIDTGRETVICNGKRLGLTSVEFRLFEHLARNPGQVQGRRVLLERVWRWCDVNEDRAGLSRTVDTHVKRLREKLGPDSEFVETIRGVGYRLKLAS